MSNDTKPPSGATTSYENAPTRTVTAGGVDFAYRELGPTTGVPVIFLTHLAANLDNWDPRVVDGIAAQHHVITFDNRGVGASSGKVPDDLDRRLPNSQLVIYPDAGHGGIFRNHREFVDTTLGFLDQ